MRLPARETKACRPLNGKYPFRAVRFADGALGVVDEDTGQAWMGHALAATRRDWVDEVALPSIPSRYGGWMATSIGGVSETVRRVGVVHATSKHRDPVVVFATHCDAGVDGSALGAALRAKRVPHALGATEETEEHGRVVEVIVHDAADLGRACAALARRGATPVLEDASVDSHRPLGVERLDRIDAEVVAYDTVLANDPDGYGVRRGRDNWRFPWMPATWTRVPITWDHLVENVLHEDVSALAQPLCQHVARRRLELGLVEPIGTVWTPADAPATPHELADHAQRNPVARRTVLRDVPELVARLDANAGSARNATVTAAEREAWGLAEVTDTQFLVCASNGTWYRPRDTHAVYTKWMPKKRWVSAALSREQSKQLVTAFYLLNVEDVEEGEVRDALCLVLYRYMVQRGYTARRLGKYKQAACHVGNGDRYRVFSKLQDTYAPERLPAQVLNKRCGADGKLRNRGSKGTRSKYKTTNRYLPARRLTRTADDEREMM